MLSPSQATDDPTDVECAEHVALVGHVPCVRADGDATVLAPTGQTVRVGSPPEEANRVVGVGPDGIAKTSAAIDLDVHGVQPAVHIVGVAAMRR